MKRPLRNRKYIREYLLGTNDPRHQQRFEERLLTDEKLLEEVSIVENELLYDYLSGALSPSERDKLEKGFLATTKGRQDLQFLRALRNHVDNFSPADGPTLLPRSWKRFLPAFLRGGNTFLRLSFVAVVILILVFAGVFVVLQNQRNQPVTVFTVALGPTTTRVIGGQELTLVEVPRGVDVVVLELPIGEQSARSYRVSLYTDKGQEILTQDGLPTESQIGRMVTLRVRSNILVPGDYRVKVKAHTTEVKFEDVASYSFRVVRR